MASPWTDVLKAKALNLHKTHSASVIAGILLKEDRVSFSRNAVIGVLHRMEAPPKPLREPKKRGPKHDRRHDGGAQTVQRINRKRQGDHHAVTKILAGGNGGLRVIQSAARDVTPRLRCVEVEPLLLTFEELPENGCKYPYGEGEPSTFRFCGHPRFTFQRIGVDVKSSYCGAHFDLTSGHGTASERAATRGIAA